MNGPRTIHQAHKRPISGLTPPSARQFRLHRSKRPCNATTSRYCAAVHGLQQRQVAMHSVRNEGTRMDEQRYVVTRKKRARGCLVDSKNARSVDAEARRMVRAVLAPSRLRTGNGRAAAGFPDETIPVDRKEIVEKNTVPPPGNTNAPTVPPPGNTRPSVLPPPGSVEATLCAFVLPHPGNYLDIAICRRVLSQANVRTKP